MLTDWTRWRVAPAGGGLMPCSPSCPLREGFPLTEKMHSDLSIASMQSKSAIRVQVVDKVRVPKRGGDAFQLLCQWEVFEIFHLQTCIPGGLKFEWDVSHFYE